MSGNNKDKDYSLRIKLDGITKSDAIEVMQDVTRSARKNAQGSRGTFTIAPTRTLKGAAEVQLLSAHAGAGTCNATMRDGRSCTAPALQGNDGYCGRHNQTCKATMRNGRPCTAPPIPGNGGYCGRHEG